ncbi:FAD/NAD(P)-binding domain-containing protein [Pisolithus microcarpus]|nr:FAD/NAD(P)-binding domain-containing protein [Pisolithus microcarpus]
MPKTDAEGTHAAWKAEYHAATKPTPVIAALVARFKAALDYLMLPVYAILHMLYLFVQGILIKVFKPRPPPERVKRPYARIAVIGGGLTGVSSAAHAASHGFEVVIYEAADRIGGIWAHENKTSGLQLNSLLYRFHPAVCWRKAFPQRDEILGEIEKVWKEYRLEERTRFNTTVRQVRRVKRVSSDDECQGRTAHVRSPSQWYINAGEDGPFDALIVAVGTNGEPVWVGFEGMPTKAERSDSTRRKSATLTSSNSKSKHVEKKDGGSAQKAGSVEKHEQWTYQGPVLHSSQLDCATREMLRGKTVAVIGSGASGVEAVETTLSRGTDRCIMIARRDKVRNVVFDVCLSAQPFGREMPFSVIWERFLVLWQYHGVEDLVPRSGIFVVNDDFLNQVRAGKCVYVRGNVVRLTTDGIVVDVRESIEGGSPSGIGKGVHECMRPTGPETDAGGSAPEAEGRVEFKADVIILATGYKHPSLSFLPQELFPKDYERPNLYLQNFSTEDWSVLLTNSAYVNAIGTFSQFIALTSDVLSDTRILLTFLLDPATRPIAKEMKLWVDVVRFIKRGAQGGALSFFTYMELTIWILTFHVLRPDRWRWTFFILFGWDVCPDDERLISLVNEGKQEA